MSPKIEVMSGNYFGSEMFNSSYCSHIITTMYTRLESRCQRWIVNKWQ